MNNILLYFTQKFPQLSSETRIVHSSNDQTGLRQEVLQILTSTEQKVHKHSHCCRKLETKCFHQQLEEPKMSTCNNPVSVVKFEKSYFLGINREKGDKEWSHDPKDSSWQREAACLILLVNSKIESCHNDATADYGTHRSSLTKNEVRQHHIENCCQTPEFG